MELSKIRNFSIIAHIDHGKSTIADRFLELTGTIEKRKMREQVLDAMDLERERGITIKMQPVTMRYMSPNGGEYRLNVIDTPGHVDFSYEVSRALSCCEGAILVVDATQGIEAQTLSHFLVAKKLGLVFLPVVNKIDLPHARVEEAALELMELGGFERDEIYEVSAKNGIGVDRVLEGIVEKIPPPKRLKDTILRARVFDSFYESHRGVIASIRVVDGKIQRGSRLKLMMKEREFTVKEVGIYTPAMKEVEALCEGEVGYVATAIKEPGEVRVGDTITEIQSNDIEPLSGYDEPRPVVWARFFPMDQGAFPLMVDGLSKLRLSDSSLVYEECSSTVLGRGFECGFLGTLHLEIIAERLRREHGLEFVVTHPSVAYRVEKNGSMTIVTSASKFPRKHECDRVYELWMCVDIVTPTEHLKDVMAVVEAFEGSVGEVKTLGTRLSLSARISLRQMVSGFFDSLKSASHGYASYHYREEGFFEAHLVRLDVFLAGERDEALSRVVSKDAALRIARKVALHIKETMPRELFTVKIQVEMEGRIIASESIPALRKDVTGYLYGGDRSRKMKLWKKQKEGKKRLKDQGKVRVDPATYLKLLKM